MQVCPGYILESDGSAHEAGNGAYLDGSRDGASAVIRASIVGEMSVENLENGKKRYGVVSHSIGSDLKIDVNDYVLARATKIMQNQVGVDIVATGEGGMKLRLPAKGMIRREDMRASETDTLVLADSFRPGDIIRCKVLSLGDRRQYFLGTAEKSCGVSYAISVSSGELMVPVSEGGVMMMMDPSDQRKEKRIVAQAE